MTSQTISLFSSKRKGDDDDGAGVVGSQKGVEVWKPSRMEVGRHRRLYLFSNPSSMIMWKRDGVYLWNLRGQRKV